MATNQFIPLPGTDPKLLARFMAKVAVEDGCWLWTAARGRKGYGAFQFRCGSTSAWCVWNAHRVAWTLFRGEIPKGLQVLHKCDVRPCVSPVHLFLGTAADNSADMVEKGRHAPPGTVLWNPRGEMNPAAKCTENMVREMRSLARSGIDTVTLADRFRLRRGTIQSIIYRRSWRHVR